MKQIIKLYFLATLAILLLPAHANAAAYPSSLNITNSVATDNSIQLTVSNVSLNSGDEYYMGCSERNLALGIDAPSYTTSGTSSTLEIANLKNETEYDCHVLIHLSNDSFASGSQFLRLKTYPKSLQITNSVAKNNSIQLTVSNVSLNSGDEYYMGCSERNLALGIDAPSYTTSGTSSTLEIANLKNETEYDCHVLIHLSNDSFASGSQIIRLEIMPEVPSSGFEDEVQTVFVHNPFPDTNINSTEGMAAAELYRRSVIGGFPDGEFKGYRNVNRAEAAKFLLLARGTEVQDLANNGKFWDVKDGEWYTKYVMTAAQKGIISGHPDGSFKPADDVNTAEFIKMLTLSFNLQKNLSHSYSDVQSGDWFVQYAGVAKKYNLFPKRSASLLGPGRKLTRNEVAVAIYQYLSNR